jgi:uncharacterized protein involved in exopolysaccharide biosynthesis
MTLVNSADQAPTHPHASPPASASGVVEMFIELGKHKLLIAGVAMLTGLASLGYSYTIPPVFSAKTVFIPPQQQQNAAASALQALGGLAGVAGAAAMKSPGDQYVALMQSAKVTNRVVDALGLKTVFNTTSSENARSILARRVRIELGKKDGLVTLEVLDASPQRAADIANQYVQELRRLTLEMTFTEAQQRRLFFERQLRLAKDKLAVAQQALQSAGVNQRTLRVEPKAAAETFAFLRAQVTASEVRIQSIRQSMTDDAPEVKAALSNLSALRRQLSLAEGADRSDGQDGYVAAYREYKYQETLFDLFARQFELAKMDESREGVVIQVIDVATPAEQRVSPKRLKKAMLSATGMSAALIAAVLLRWKWRLVMQDAASRERMLRLKRAWLGLSPRA